jgi:hypothetical protein
MANTYSSILYSNSKSVSLFVIAIMFDTVNFWIDSSNYVESKILEKLHEKCIDVTDVILS